MENILTKGEGLPGWAKGVIFVTAAGTIVIVGWTIYNKVMNRMKIAGDLKEKRDVVGEINKLASSGVNPTLSADKFATGADQLFTAMDGYGTDTNSIYDVFSKMQNDADVLSLMNAYGIKEISSGAFNPEPNFKGTLAGALTSELSASERKTLNDKLAAKKITYTF